MLIVTLATVVLSCLVGGVFVWRAVIQYRSSKEYREGADYNLPQPQFLLPLLLIGGIVVLLVTLALTALVYRVLGGSSLANSPLGLPEGSIGAVIALMLVVIFAIMAAFLYIQVYMGEGLTETLYNVTREQLGNLPAERIMSQTYDQKSDTYAVAVLYPNSRSNEFAKDIMQITGTLLVRRKQMLVPVSLLGWKKCG